VMAVRGGYGLTRLLSQIQWKKITRAKKIWIGHSDFTAFNLALWAHTQEQSYAGPMASYDFGGSEISAFTEKHFWNFLKQQHTVLKVRAAVQPQVSAQGTLWGGNLTVLNSLIGTPHFPQVKSGILFLEDVNEHPYRIERMLYQLHDAGVLKQQRALLLGDFSAYRLGLRDNGYSFDTMLAHLREKFSLPIFTHLPFGHCANKLTLPVGGYARVEGVRGGYQLSVSTTRF
jgi:muramoyltetrapeptide carboxypeptidase